MEIIKPKIHGFKCFGKDLTTRFGQQMELHKIYITEEIPKFKSSGFHMCTHMEDTLRYFDSFNEDIEICRVIGYPEYQEYSDEYYGYYQMYSCQGIELVEKLSREQIIKMADELATETYGIRLARFCRDFQLTEEELEYFINKYNDGYHNYIISLLETMYKDRSKCKKIIL